MHRDGTLIYEEMPLRCRVVSIRCAEESMRGVRGLYI